MEQSISASEAESGISKILNAAGNSDVETVIKKGERNVAVIIGYDRYLELRRQIREREARFAVYDEIRNRNKDKNQEQIENDVEAAVQLVIS